MVLYTLCWGQSVGGAYPSVTVYHPFAGKRVQIKLLSWSGCYDPDVDDFSAAGGKIPQPIRLHFGDELQADGMGYFVTNNNSIGNYYIYPNAFHVDPFIFYTNVNDVNTSRAWAFCQRHKAPKLIGTLVGNNFTVQLSPVTKQINDDYDPHFAYLADAHYFKAEFDIKEIQ